MFIELKGFVHQVDLLDTNLYFIPSYFENLFVKKTHFFHFLGTLCFICFIFFPQDGPSAGVTMAVALVSLALDIPVRRRTFDHQEPDRPKPSCQVGCGNDWGADVDGQSAQGAVHRKKRSAAEDCSCQVGGIQEKALPWGSIDGPDPTA